MSDDRSQFYRFGPPHEVCEVEGCDLPSQTLACDTIVDQEETEARNDGWVHYKKYGEAYARCIVHQQLTLVFQADGKTLIPPPVDVINLFDREKRISVRQSGMPLEEISRLQSLPLPQHHTENA